MVELMGMGGKKWKRRRSDNEYPHAATGVTQAPDCSVGAGTAVMLEVATGHADIGPEIALGGGRTYGDARSSASGCFRGYRVISIKANLA